MGCSQSTPVEGAVESRQQPSHKTGSSSNVAQHRKSFEYANCGISVFDSLWAAATSFSLSFKKKNFKVQEMPYLTKDPISKSIADSPRVSFTFLI